MAQKGDFIGFTFNGTHSSDLGIVRTSNGSRYNSNLLPSSSDQTVAVPGGDGVYFFGTNYQTRVFQLQIASDEILESTLRKIQQTWGDKQIHELIFDETPYKVYMAKCTNMPQFNFLCFDENNHRVYKGEGSVEFTCYYPYAKSRHKFRDWYVVQNSNNQYINVPEWNSNEVVIRDNMLHNHYLVGGSTTFNPPTHIDVDTTALDLCNINEWAAASGMREHQTILDTPTGLNQGDKNRVYVYNPGDIEADFQLWFLPNNAISLIYYSDSSTPDYHKQISFDFSDVDFAPAWEAEKYYSYDGLIYIELEAKPEDWDTHYDDYFYKEGNTYYSVEPAQLIQYDSKTELFTGYITVNTTNGKLYNKYITSGDFFKIPKMQPTDDNITSHLQLVTGDYQASTAEIFQITYDYLYF